jgi:hypothetical protein
MFAVGDRVKVVGKKSKKFDGALGVVDHDDTSFGGWVWATFAVVGRKAFTPDELAKVEVTVLEGSLYVGLHEPAFPATASSRPWPPCTWRRCATRRRCCSSWGSGS